MGREDLWSNPNQNTQLFIAATSCRMQTKSDSALCQITLVFDIINIVIITIDLRLSHAPLVKTINNLTDRAANRGSIPVAARTSRW